MKQKTQGRCLSLSSDPCMKRLKRILYYSPSETQNKVFLKNIFDNPNCVQQKKCFNPQFEYEDTPVCWVSEHDQEQAFLRLKERYLNLLLLDFRWFPSQKFDRSVLMDRVTRFLTQLDSADDLEVRYGFHRVMVLVSGPDQDQVDRVIRDLGALGVGSVMRQHIPDGSNPAEMEESYVTFAGHVLREALKLISDRKPGTRAVCAAGGGITGIYFEIGALKCLDDCLSHGAVNTFDMYFGISAGAVVTGLLAVGYSVDEIMAALAGVEGGRIQPMSLSLMRLAHLNYSDLLTRINHVATSLPWLIWDVVRGDKKLSLDSLFFEYSDMLGAPFHSNYFEKLLHDLLSAPGVTNDFRKLPYPLYIGVSDQDARQHVLFGTKGNDTVPISRAIQASLSVNPVFSAVPIKGRYFEDGAVTRTSNFAEAIQRGANLIFVIDPFVPYVSKQSGFARKKGVLYNIDQDIRTVSFTRFESTRNWVLRKHPHVSSYTFLPSNRIRKLMSVNPMDHRPYLEIWRGAYLSTMKRIQFLRHRMQGDLKPFGIALDLSKAEAVTDQLSHVKTPTFADFYPDRQISIRKPALCFDDET